MKKTARVSLSSPSWIFYNSPLRPLADSEADSEADFEADFASAP